MIFNNKRSTIAVALSLALLASSLPYPLGTFFIEAQEQIQIFPSVLEDDWQNVEAAFALDLKETAVLGEFTTVGETEFRPRC